jgi:hypothetical protein
MWCNHYHLRNMFEHQQQEEEEEEQQQQESLVQVLDEVLSFVEREEWIYYGGVCRLWRGRYERFNTQKITTVKAACVSAPRIELGYASRLLAMGGQAPEGWLFERELGRWASDISVILRAREVGMVQWTQYICWGAAKEGRLSLLKQLHLEHGCPLGDGIHLYASQAPTPEVLVWLKSIHAGWWDEATMKWMMVCGAAHFGRIENARWLREHAGLKGWSAWTIYDAACHNQKLFIEWARSQRCGWGWKPGYCNRLKNEPNAAETFEWLHTQKGFPCNCR